MTTKGHCLCGKTRFEFDGDMTWQGHCHCETCRRNCSAPFTSFFGVPRAAYRWTGDPPGIYQSTEGVCRHFCKNCGTPMAYDGDRDKIDIHFYAASLGDPSKFTPTTHFHYDEKLPWVIIHDTLEKRGI